MGDVNGRRRIGRFGNTEGRLNPTNPAILRKVLFNELLERTTIFELGVLLKFPI